ncbi:MAG TPA: 3'-5' exonuclease [Ardenticatenaceae bacterium]|nr:3'-5' exonuclease [Ardenticatenaceae bacterium]
MTQRPLSALTFVAIDTETTGGSASADADRIVELAAVRFTLAGVEAVWERTIWPHRPISPWAQRLHGIDIEQLGDAPCFHEVVDDFLAFVDGAVVVMHNAPFDCAFLGVQLAEVERRWQPIVFDTLRLLRRHFHLPSNSLGPAIRHFGLPVPPTHRAASDAEATAHLFLHLLQRLGAPTGLADCLRLHGAPSTVSLRVPQGASPAVVSAARAGTPVAVHYSTRGTPLVGRIEGLAVGERAGYCTLRLTNSRRLHLAHDRILRVDRH